MSLREKIEDKHTEAEHTVFAEKLVSGNITQEEYTDWLYQLMIIYGALETVAKAAGIFDELTGIERTYRIYQDFVDRAGKDYKNTVKDTTRAYHRYLLDLYPDRNKILAHVYVRHMGDMYGGQLIAKNVSGQHKFYEFTNRPALIDKLRSMLNDEIADEAIAAFDWSIRLMNDF